MSESIGGDTVDPYAAPRASTWSVEAPAADERRLARRLVRLAAAFVDGFAFLVACMPLVVSAALASPAQNSGLTYASMFERASVSAILASAALVVALCAWQLVQLARRGQTLGKRVARIKIVRAHGASASFGRIFWLRIVAPTLIGYIPFVGPLFSLVDSVCIFREDRRCIHDLMADTIVIAV